MEKHFLFVFLVVLVSHMSRSHAQDKAARAVKTAVRSRSVIPISVLKELNNVGSTEFIKNFLVKKTQRRPAGPDDSEIVGPGGANDTDVVNETLTEQFEKEAFVEAGSSDDEGASIAASYLSEPGQGCMPNLTSVAIPKPELSDEIYWPDCVMLEQCGGCCSHELLECQPVRIEKQVVNVLKAEYQVSTGMFELVGLVNKELDNHKACKCMCKLRQNDCNLAKQDYLEDECRCRCKNEVEALSCGSSKKWDEEKCECVCRSVYLCHDDEYFAHQSCSCAKLADIDIDQLAEENPCLLVSCRAGYRAVYKNNQCVCEVSSRWGEVEAGSFDEDETPARTTTPRPRVRPRPRPDRRRRMVHRERPRTRRDVLYEEDDEE